MVDHFTGTVYVLTFPQSLVRITRAIVPLFVGRTYIELGYEVDDVAGADGYGILVGAGSAFQRASQYFTYQCPSIIYNIRNPI
ncbi:MAG: hypothetical protein O6945_03720 [Gammaproteobacteria bacterium]|nr:hypothetical protein [Gammaproteobacteria bacterium]